MAPLSPSAPQPAPARGEPGRASALLSICYALADQDFHRTKSIGIFNLSVGLLAALSRRPEVGRLHVLGNRELTGSIPTGPKVTLSEHNSVRDGKLNRIWWDQVGVARAMGRSGCAWLFLPKGFTPWMAPVRGRIACYVHDVVQLFFRERYPQAFSGLDRRYFTLLLRSTLRRADVIFTNSEFSRQEVQRFAVSVGLRPPPIQVAGIGFEPPRRGLIPKRDQILVLISRWPHKRSDLAVEYLGRWQRETEYRGTLVWVGEAPDDLAWPAYPNWERQTRVSQPAYDELVAASRALVQFTEYEGFGMPPVEAVLRGTCPVYSRIPATVEVMAGAGQPFATESYESFQRALAEAMQTPPARLAGWAENLSTRFSWDAVAQRVIGGLRAAEANPHRLERP